MNFVFKLCASIGLASTQTTDIPSGYNGNFFLMEGIQPTYNELGIVNWGMSFGKMSNGTSMYVPNLALSTQQAFLSVLSQECPVEKCGGQADTRKIQKSMNMYNSSASESGFDALDIAGTKVPDRVANMEIIKQADNGLATYPVTSDFVFDDVVINSTQYQREVVLPAMGFAEITNFENSPPLFYYNGYMGIQPYQSLPESDQPFSFMKQLADRNIITEHIVSVNIVDPGLDIQGMYKYKSVVCFGGQPFNLNGVKVIKTLLDSNGKASWKVSGSKISFGSATSPYPLGINEVRQLTFDPSMPFIYIPKKDWETILAHVQDSTLWPPPNIITNGDSAHGIAATAMFTHWSCTQTRSVVGYSKFTFSVTVYDDATGVDNGHVIDLNFMEMMIEGAYFGFAQRCYLPFFMHNKENPDGTANTDWYMGAHSILKEVLVFDNSPFIKNGAANAQIGFSTMNPDKPEEPHFVFNNLYNDTTKNPSGEIKDTIDPLSQLMDSSVFTGPMDMSTMTVPNPMIQGDDSLTDFYSIDEQKPVAPPTPETDSWLKQNLVLVIVVGVVGFMVLAALLYCLCCKANKQGYQNALYDEDSSMKARIQ